AELSPGRVASALHDRPQGQEKQDQARDLNEVGEDRQETTPRDAPDVVSQADFPEEQAGESANLCQESVPVDVGGRARHGRPAEGPEFLRSANDYQEHEMDASDGRRGDGVPERPVIARTRYQKPDPGSRGKPVTQS